MPNYIPYLILTLISLTLLVSIMVRERQFGMIVLFLSYSGMVYVAEFFVMVWGNSYEYFPEVLGNRYYDNVAGAAVSNLLIIPALGMVVAVYRLKFRWFILFAASLAGVEWLFIRLHIYEPHWWKIPYTWAALIFFFYLTTFWLNQLRKGIGFYRFVSLWMQAWGAIGTVMFILGAMGIRYYHFGFFENMYRDDVFGGALMGMFKAGLFSIFVIRFAGSRWKWLAPILVFALDLPLYAAGWLIVSIPFWSYTMVNLILSFMLLWWNSYAYRFIYNMIEANPMSEAEKK